MLSRAGLDVDQFLAEAVESVARALPQLAGWVGTHDPATRLLTSCRKFGDFAGKDDDDCAFGRIEYESDEPTTVLRMFGSGTVAVAMHRFTDGSTTRSPRMALLAAPEYGYHDELRLLFRDREALWGAMGMFRGARDPKFSDQEVELAASLSHYFARGIRGGILARTLDGPAPHDDAGPAVVVVSAKDEIAQFTPGANARLEQLRELDASPAANGRGLRLADGRVDPMGVLSALVGTARSTARGREASIPRVRVRGADGMWMLLHASPLEGTAERAGDVAITIEEARPPEIVPLVVSAFELTPRERDITQLVLQGVDTKEIADALHLSAYTVQDHLKSVFDKAEVRSRKELISRVYFDQYQPRMGRTRYSDSGFASVA